MNCEELAEQDSNIEDIIIKGINNKSILHLFIKSTYADRTEIRNLEWVLDVLREMIITMKIKSIGVAQTGNLIDPQFLIPVVEFFKKYLCEINIKVTICTDDIVIPDPQYRKAIMKENHEALIGGHRSRSTTLNHIEERFTWRGIESDVEEFMKYCEDCRKRKLVR